MNAWSPNPVAVGFYERQLVSFGLTRRRSFHSFNIDSFLRAYSLENMLKYERNEWQTINNLNSEASFASFKGVCYLNAFTNKTKK